jgi:uncharacterized membrane protein YgdD (TMEM256/DUF423 family)
VNSTNRLGFWSAILTAVFAAAFLGVGFFGSSYTEGIKYPYVLTAIRPLDYVVWYPAVFLALAFLVLLVCINRDTPDDKKVFSQIALSFALVYTGLTVSDFFIQWTVVLPSILSNETSGLSLLSIYNPHGVPIAVESLGYLMMDAALLFLAAVFVGGSRLERAIRWLFVTGSVLAVGSFSALSLSGYPIVVFEVVAIVINVTVLIPSGALLSLFFKRALS